MERYLFKCNFCNREQLQESETELKVDDEITCKYCKMRSTVDQISDESRRILA